VPWITHHE